MKKTLLSIFFLAFLGMAASPCAAEIRPQPSSHDLVFRSPAKTWDEAVPLGNGMVGALVWQKGAKLRLSLDRADLWDLRPVPNLSAPEWKFRWVVEQWKKNDYKPVQDKFDKPYDADPAPSKIPAGALEFDLAAFGSPESVRLFVSEAVCRIQWPGGESLETFVHATKPMGWFRIKGAGKDIAPNLIMPLYQAAEDGGDLNPVTGQGLRRLGYEQGRVRPAADLLTYHQKGWGEFYYDIAVAWKRSGAGDIEGVWSISSKFSDDKKESSAEAIVRSELARGFSVNFDEHAAWWRNFWSRSSVTVPDDVLEKQWVLEQYKFGSAARRGAPPISLQAVWTADNGKLPPWKGDFHHDLNTQLSYWPCYSANHLEEGLGFLDWLWELRPVFKKYTKAYFETNGLNVPGVSTLAGEPMGGWIQYSFGPTVGAWLAQHFYLHWRYSMDRKFLEDRAYPWIMDVAVHLDELSRRDERGRRRLPASSSPEIFDNSAKAWFAETTNFDLALIKWTFQTAAELAAELGRTGEAKKWKTILGEWPDFAVDPKLGLMFAPGVPYAESHRHFSHLMAFHPFGLIDWSHGPSDQAVIKNTLATLDKIGPDLWCGYSYSWLGNLKARAFDGDGAAQALKIFAACFCLPNSFHVNGDQSGTGKSKFTYRPFTLEGNFAFAAGLQEMLLQSHTGVIHLFPAVPDSWKDISFNDLRAQGAFLVSAKKTNGQVMEVRIVSEKGGKLKLLNPFEFAFTVDGLWRRPSEKLIELETRPGQEIRLEAHDE
ncbi:MAG: glycoside hydrolase family 95-like protein [Candidatus Aminicenantales bacterium]